MQRGLRYLGALTIPNTRRRIPSSAAACCYHSTASPVPSTSAVTLDSPQTYSLNDDPRETGHATLSEDTNQVVDDDKAEQPSRGRGAKIRPSKYGTTHPTADLSTSSLKSFTSSDIKFERPTNPNSKAKIARLAHDLQRVLHNPGQIHRMKDPRSKEEISNFDTRISQIPSPEEMNMPALSVFTKPSEDPVLAKLAQQNQVSFAGSTSSLTGILTHIWCLLNPGRELNMNSLSAAFDDKSKKIGAGSLLPPSVVLTKKANVWFIDNDKAWDPSEGSNNLLSDLGHIGEKLLTVKPEEFEKYKQNYPHADKAAWEKKVMEEPMAYAYCKYGKLLMRSQIDGEEPSLPRRTFDIKTRATVSVRLDRLNHVEASGYKLRTLRGELESYEREMYDLMRSAYLKYSMQARIGGMDGIFVAHHNTKEMFGFQYVPLEDMDECTSGSYEAAERTFKLGVAIMEEALQTVMEHVTVEDKFSLTFDTAGDRSHMNIFLSQAGKDLQMFTFRLGSIEVVDDNTESVELAKEVTADSVKAQSTFQGTRKRRLQFKNMFRPSNLTPENMATLDLHNAHEEGEEPKQNEPARLPFDLIPGIKYIMPFPFIKELRDLARKGLKEDKIRIAQAVSEALTARQARRRQRSRLVPRPKKVKVGDWPPKSVNLKQAREKAAERKNESPKLVNLQ